MALKDIFTGVAPSKKEQAQQEIDRKKEELRKSIEQQPTYQIPKEAQQMLDMYQAYGKQLEGLKGYGQEALDIAKQRTAQAEMPGMGIAREQIQAGTAGTVQNILEAGGGGVGALGAITQAGQNELNAMRDLAIQNQQYQRQAESEYRNALMSQAGLESSLLGQSAQMQAAGLGMMTGQRALQQESELDKYRTLQQFDIGELGNIVAAEKARREKNAQILTGTLSTIGTVAGGIFGGPAGAAAGGLLGNLAGKGLSNIGGSASDVGSDMNFSQSNPYGLEAGTFGSGQLGKSGFN